MIHYLQIKPYIYFLYVIHYFEYFIRKYWIDDFNL